MSAALVRQALEFVDPDETNSKAKKRGAGRSRQQPTAGQDKQPLKHNLKKRSLEKNQKNTEEVVKRLLKLSQATVDKEVAGKIVERAVKGKALADKIEINTEPEKSILFPDEDEEFDQFEEELFCS